MANEFHLPDVGEGLAEATILTWYVGVGEKVGLDEPLVEVETDKAVVDLPSPFAGVVLHLGGEEGDVLAVGAVLAVVGVAGETWMPPGRAEPAAQSGDAAPIVGTLDEAPSSISPAAMGPATALPRVRRLATELGVDLGDLAGSGPGGRVTEDDVRGSAGGVARGPVERVRMSATRRAVADHMARAWREIPRVTTYDEADAEPLLARRAGPGRPTFESLFIAAVVPLLAEFPAFNAALVADTIVHKKYYDVGFAVDTPEGLVVAVVRGADALDQPALDGEIRRLAEAAVNRTAKVEELRGQTFTISNIGAVGGRFGTPIVPLGTSAILSIGRADPRPVVRDGEIVVGQRFPLSLSYDHRLIDGSTGRAFMTAVVTALST